MITFFSRAGYPLWMQLIISRWPEVFLTPNPHIFDKPTPEIATIDPKYRVNLRCGFEGCYEGWADLIETIAGTATALVQSLRESGLQSDAFIHSRIVKAKLGSLRWTGDNNLKEPHRTLFAGYVVSVCDRSTSICLVCGKYGKVRDINNWLEVLCDADYARRTKRRRPPHQ